MKGLTAGVAVVRVALVALGLSMLSPFAVSGQKAIAGFIETLPIDKLKQLFPRATAFTRSRLSCTEKPTAGRSFTS